MKKLTLLIVSIILFALSGCGSGGGDADGNQPVPDTKINFTLTSFDASNGKIHTVMNLEASVLPKDVKVNLKHFTLNSLNECTLSNTIFNGQTDTSLEFTHIGSAKVLTIDSDYHCPNDITLSSSNIMLNYDKWVIKGDGSPERGPFPKSINLGNIGGEDGSNYKVFPPKDFIVDSADYPYTINVAVSTTDETGTHPAVDTNVTAEFLPAQFGWIENYDVLTDASGIAKFRYHSPKSLDGLKNTNIKFYAAGDTSNKQSTQLIFKSYENGKYQVFPDKNLTVDIANTTYTINVTVSTTDETGTHPAVDTNVTAEFLPAQFGWIENYDVLTDASGIAKFRYHSPKSLDGLKNTNIKFYAAGDTSNKQSTQLIFKSYENGKYQVFPDKNLTVDIANTTYTINVTVSTTDETGTHPAVGVNVNADFLQPIFGSLINYTATTDNSGIAQFQYHSPKNLHGLEDSYLSFYIGKDNTIKEKTKLIFKPLEGVDRLYIIPQTLQVTQSNEEQNITIVTVNKDNIGVPASIQIEQLYNGDGKDYGKFSTNLVTTDANGIGSFTYTSPQSLYGLSDRNITLSENKSGVTKDLQIIYDKGSLDYEISIETPDKLSIEQNTSIVVYIHERDKPKALIDDENVKDVVLNVKDYYNMIGFSDSDSIRYNYSESAKKKVDIETKKLSGVALIEVEATIFNGKRDITIQTVIPITIMSGPISSISLNYISTEANSENGLFYDYYNVHAVDKYANPVNDGSHFHPTLICGGNEKNTTAPATIIPAFADANSSFGEISKGPEYTIFEDIHNRPFDVVNPNRDRLIVLPTNDASSKNYIGAWTISQVFGDYELALEEDYYGQDAKGLRYIVGDEDRLINGEIHVADVTDANDGQNYTIDGNGTAKIKVAYDPSFVAHTYTLSATAYSENSRSGTAVKDSFRGLESSLTETQVTVYIPKNKTVDANLTLYISTPAGGQVWLDDVDIVPSSLTTEPPENCMINFDAKTTDLHTKRGRITVNVKALKTDENTTEDTPCTVKWSGKNSGIYLEY